MLARRFWASVTLQAVKASKADEMTIKKNIVAVFIPSSELDEEAPVDTK